MAQEAGKIASQIAQTDIGFRDIRERVNNLRSLIEDLKKAG
jgi:hypothetical protein